SLGSSTHFFRRLKLGDSAEAQVRPQSVSSVFKELNMSINGLIEEGEAFSRLHEGAARTRVDVLVIGGGQAGLSAGYYLKQPGGGFGIVVANTRAGDAG